MRFSRAELQRAVVSFFRPAESSFSLELGALVQPVLPLVRGLDTTPYSSVGLPLARGATVAAVAAEFGYITWAPMEGSAFQTTKIVLVNGTGAAQTLDLRFLTAANVTAAGLALLGNFFELAPRDPSAIAAPVQMVTGTHTAILGSLLCRVVVGAGLTMDIDLPEPGHVLFGQGTIPSLAVVNTAVNDSVTVTAFGRIWPMPL